MTDQEPRSDGDLTGKAGQSAEPAKPAAEYNNELFAIMADTAPVMIWISGQDKLCNFFNTPWLEFTGRSMKDELGNGWTEGVHPDDYSGCLETYVQAFDARRKFRMEYRLKRFDGEYRWILDTGTPRFDSNGEFAGYVGSCIDITERKELEDKLKQLNEDLENRVMERTAELQEANLALKTARDEALDACQLKTSFIASISHELRTPLSAILGVNELLLAAQLSSEQADLATIVQNSAESLLVIVNDLLDISKIEAGRMDVESVPFNLIFVVQECARLFSDAARSKNLLLTTQIDQRIPEFVIGDSVRIRQVLVNLINNGIKFTDSGSVTLRATVERESGDFVTVKFLVEDSGIGIAQESLSHLFQPFVQLETRYKYGGTGLGLAISKKLSEMMGGNIGVTSERGKGSCFWFSVPFRLLKQHYIDVTAPDGSAQPITFHAKYPVLLVEDNPVLQVVAAKQLAVIGLRAQTVGSGKEAIELVEKSDYVLVLLDCSLPDISGYETARTIRDRETNRKAKRVPIIAVTAVDGASEEEKCYQAGMDDFLTKPLTIEKLRKKLHPWLLLDGEISQRLS